MQIYRFLYLLRIFIEKKSHKSTFILRGIDLGNFAKLS